MIFRRLLTHILYGKLYIVKYNLDGNNEVVFIFKAKPIKVPVVFSYVNLFVWFFIQRLFLQWILVRG